MGWFIERPTPFIPEFLNRMMQLNYPKKRIDLLIHNTVGILAAKYILFIIYINFGLYEFRHPRQKEAIQKLLNYATQHKRFQDFEIVLKASETHNFLHTMPLVQHGREF